MKRAWIVEKYTREMKYSERKEIGPYCSMNADNACVRELERCDSLEEAMEAIENYEPNVRKFTNAGMVFYVVEEYAIEKCYLDEDGDPEYSAGFEGIRDDWKFEDGEMVRI